jgi:hypothetical protein
MMPFWNVSKDTVKSDVPSVYGEGMMNATHARMDQRKSLETSGLRCTPRNVAIPKVRLHTTLASMVANCRLGWRWVS